MKKTLKQLKDSKAVALETMQRLIETAEQEDRNLNVDEQSAFDEAETTATDMTARVGRLERSLDLTKTPVVPVTFATQNVKATDKDLQRFSLTAAATAAYNGQMEGLVKEMHQEARSENPGRLFRGVGIPSIVLETRTDLPAGSAQVNPTDVGSFVDQLQANSVLAAAGANFYSGLTADRKFPIVADIDSGFVAEGGGTGQDAAGSLTNITLDPKKLISVVSMSAEMMTQNKSAEAALQRNMTRSIMAAFEKALLQDAATTAQGPNSLFEAAAALTGSGSISKAELFEAERLILNANYNPATGRFGYLFNAGALAALKTEAGIDYVAAFADFAAKQANGYKYGVTSNLGIKAPAYSEAMLFGDFSDVHMATFGGLDIISDRFTDAHKGLSRLVVVSLMDAKAGHSNSLVKYTVA
jgi:HK97 family phage major capsid protein